ncbi:hypothetical protein TYRP_015341 [Tyrophagus putrescentiae]|nr:hypothetical protein TYRP_015341 [Tyrophagus putrescentiae]
MSHQHSGQQSVSDTVPSGDLDSPVVLALISACPAPAYHEQVQHSVSAVPQHFFCFCSCPTLKPAARVETPSSSEVEAVEEEGGGGGGGTPMMIKSRGKKGGHIIYMGRRRRSVDEVQQQQEQPFTFYRLD